MIIVLSRGEATIPGVLGHEIGPSLKAIGQLIAIGVCWYLMFLWVEIVVNNAKNREIFARAQAI